MRASTRAVLGVVVVLCVVVIARIVVLQKAPSSTSAIVERQVVVNREDTQARGFPVEHHSFEGRGRAVVTNASVEEVSATAEKSVHIALDSGVSLQGRLLDWNRQPITTMPASVQLTNDRSQVVSVEIREGGSFSAEGLQPGYWSLMAEAQGYRPRTIEFQLSSELRVVTRDIVLDKRVVISAYAVTPTGDAIFQDRSSNLGKVTVIATVERPEADVLWNYKARLGIYGVAEFSPSVKNEDVGFVGRIELLDQSPVYVSLMLNQTRIATEFVALGVEQVRFVLSPHDIESGLSSIQYRLVDSETGHPLVASFAMIANSGAARLASSESRNSATGIIRHERIAAGVLELTARVKGYEFFQKTIELGVAVHLNLGDIPLGRSVHIIGVVVDASGRPVQGASVFAREIANSRLGETREMMQTVMNTVNFTDSSSDADGRFSLAVGVGRYRIWALGGKPLLKSANTVIDTRQPSSEVLLSVLAPSGVVFRDQFERFDGLFVRVIDEHDIEVYSHKLGGVRLPATNLPQAAYRAEVRDGTTLLSAHSFVLGGTALAIEL